MGYSKLIAILLVLLIGLPAAAGWVKPDGKRASAAPAPGIGPIIWVVDGATGETGVLDRFACGDDSSFSVDSGATTILGDVQTCKESSGGKMDCEDDSSAGTVSAGNYAFIRQGTYVRVQWTVGVAGDRIYFDCTTP